MVMATRAVFSERCTWCSNKDRQRRHTLKTPVKEGIHVSQVFHSYCAKSHFHPNSNWICEKCFLILRKLVNTEDHLQTCLKALMDAAGLLVPVQSLKRARPITELPSSQPTQASKRLSLSDSLKSHERTTTQKRVCILCII